MSERLKGIEAFVTAVEAGNFALAAQRLQLTRSAVAKTIARLETRLGTRLFHRSTRSQSLTDDGQAYYERCRRALAELDAADAAIDAGQHTPAGRVRITMPALLGRTYLTALLLDLQAQHPGLTLDLRYSDRRVDLVEEGFDLAIRSGPLDDTAMLKARPLGQQVMGVYASPAYIASHGAPASVDDLLSAPERHRYVGYLRDVTQVRWTFLDAGGQTVSFALPPERCSVTVDSLDVVAAAAVRGAGLARLPHLLAADAVAQGQLQLVFEESHPFGFALHAVWPLAPSLPMKTRAVIDWLAQQLPPRLAVVPPTKSALPITPQAAPSRRRRGHA